MTSEIEDPRQNKLNQLIDNLSLANNGAFLAWSHSPSERDLILDEIKSELDAEIISYKIKPADLENADNLKNWVWGNKELHVAKNPDKVRILLVDAGDIDPDTFPTLPDIFSVFNANRDGLSMNPNGPFLILMPSRTNRIKVGCYRDFISGTHQIEF